MEPKIYCGASSRHIHCEQYDFKVGEILKIFGDESPNEGTTWLDLRNCTGTIDSRTLALLPALEYLNITGSSLEILPKSFGHLSKLRAIDFRKSKVVITKEIFEGCTAKHLLLEDLTLPDTDCLSHLRDLDSLTLESCTIKKFSGNILHNLNSLEYLFIKKCQMDSFDDFPPDVQKLENLSLTLNKIRNLNYQAILKLENLKYLALFDNETTSTINFEDFNKLSKLETILFNASVYKGFNFSSFPNLKKVQLGTYVDEVSEEEIAFMDHLKSLNLEFEWACCKTPEVDMSKVLICA